MRGLTGEEVTFLQVCMPPDAHQPIYRSQIDPVGWANARAMRVSLSARGLVKVERVEDPMFVDYWLNYSRITPLGRIALACYAASRTLVSL